MRRRASSVLMLLAAALAASATCHAQAPAREGDDPGARSVAAPAAAPAATTATTATTEESRAPARSRSAFGRVMALMIAALEHPSRQPGERVQPRHAPVRTTGAGTPIGIEVGAAFRDALDANTVPDRKDVAIDKRHRDIAPDAGTGGAAAATVPRVAPPEPPVLRQSALAGPG